MSTTGPAPQQQATVRQYTGVEEARYEDEAGRGWVTFAGVILALLAAVNFIDGVAAVSKSTFFVGNAKFVLSDLKTWGWVLIVMAVIQLATAAGVWLGWQGARWVGGAVAALEGRALGRRGDRRVERDRAAHDHAGLPVLVALPVRAGRPRHLRADRTRAPGADLMRPTRVTATLALVVALGACGGQS